MKHQIQDGSQYNSLIPKSKNEISNLAKGDTDIGLREMKKWTKKYAWQAKQIAPHLKGATLEATVNNVHAFLYNHIQYLADAELQQLRSPSNSWANRTKGIDCKSYSIFASAILLNLGIPSFFRKIKQPFFKVTDWTHVYLVIPKNQKTKKADSNYFVLDATLQLNQEVPFAEKKDLLMEAQLQYRGLNGVPDANPTVNALPNFLAFADYLKEIGFDPSALQTLVNRVTTLINNGVEPHFKFSESGVMVNDTFIVIPKNLGLNGLFDNTPSFSNRFSSTDFGSFGTSNSFDVKVPSFSSGKSLSKNSFGRGNTSTKKTFSDKFKSQFGTTDLTNFNVGNFAKGQITQVLADTGIPFAGTITSLFSKFLGGFGRSAANTTSQVAIIEQNTQYIDGVLAAANASNITEVLNEASRFLTFQIRAYQRNIERRAKWAPKTIAAWKMHSQAFENYKQQKFLPFISQLKSSGFRIAQGSKQETQESLQNVYPTTLDISTGQKNDAKLGPITYTIYQVTAPAGKTTAFNNAANPSAKPKASLAGFGVVGILLAALALGGGTKKAINKSKNN